MGCARFSGRLAGDRTWIRRRARQPGRRHLRPGFPCFQWVAAPYRPMCNSQAIGSHGRHRERERSDPVATRRASSRSHARIRRLSKSAVWIATSLRSSRRRSPHLGSYAHVRPRGTSLPRGRWVRKNGPPLFAGRGFHLISGLQQIFRAFVTRRAPPLEGEVGGGCAGWPRRFAPRDDRAATLAVTGVRHVRPPRQAQRTSLESGRGAGTRPDTCR